MGWPSRSPGGGPCIFTPLTALLDAHADLTSRREFRGHVTAGVVPASHRPIHIDAHSIPANPAKEEPERQHFDFRLLFRTSAEVVELQAEEVTAAAWRDVDTIADETLRNRVPHTLR
ncbi:hypothetical protein ACFWR9_40410 [Streptomyces sp. NPDC058534]|uniref:hypothetical protein n=1 Tax=Streptomyces sp. NPDC058534 TaxID=3346541 RepID=UPI00365ED05D